MIQLASSQPASDQTRVATKDRLQRRVATAAVDHATDGSREFQLFRSLDVERKGEVSVSDLLDALSSVGLSPDDTRLAETTKKLELNARRRDKLSYDEFSDLIRPNILLVDQALQGKMVIPDFARFCAIS